MFATDKVCKVLLLCREAFTSAVPHIQKLKLPYYYHLLILKFSLNMVIVHNTCNMIMVVRLFV